MLVLEVGALQMQKTGKWSDMSARAIPEVVFSMGALV